MKEEIKMKKIITLTLAIVVLFSAVGMSVSAETVETANVYVTISDANGALALAQEKITVTDTDGDGALTINDALYAAHEAKYEGGAAAGYEAYESEYGLSLSRLWGTANGGSYGYYLNNASAWSLVDPVKEGDHLNAYVFTDLTAWSDTYCYFNVNEATANADEEITLTLSMAAFDQSYNPVTLPVEGATIVINGEKTEYKTDARGEVTFTLSLGGVNLISAVSDTLTLVPPVCKVSVMKSAENKPEETPTPDKTDETEKNEQVKSPVTGDTAVPMCAVLLAISAIAALVCVKNKLNEE